MLRATATIIDEDDNLLEGDDLVPDGGTVRVPMPFMDHAMNETLKRAFGMKSSAPVIHDGMGNPAGYRAGYAFCEEFDDIRAKGRLDYCKKLADAWRHPTPQREGDRQDKRSQRLTDGEAAWNDMRVCLSNAWRKK